jgi:Sulfotransferase family
MAFRFLMLSAMYENGGNTTHRLLDGHPQMYVYPFESQIGTRLVQDHLTSMFPVKYRWPVFDIEATPYHDYKSIIDEECKVRARTPHVSKFRHMPFDFSDDERLAIFEKYVGELGRGRPTIVEAFFRATFDAWKDYAVTGKQVVYVGYSPIIAVDGAKILKELPQAHVLHVVRNPWSAYADTKKRPVPLSIEKYMTAWCTCQYFALVVQRLHPYRMHVRRYEDIIADPKKTLEKVFSEMDLEVANSLKTPTWNTNPLEENFPWGTIRRSTAEVNKATARELSQEEIDLVALWAKPYLDLFDYASYM